MSEQTKAMIKNDAVYNKLKYTAQIILPAVATLYFALSEVWGLPFGPEVVASITAFDTFLGVTLRVSSSNYYNSPERFDGSINLTEDADTKRFTLEYDGDPYEIESKDELIFRVNKP